MNDKRRNVRPAARAVSVRRAAAAVTAFALALASWQARADWVRVSSSQQSVFYIDSKKSPRVGDNVMIWVLRNHKAMQASQSLMVRSSKDQIEVDCAGRRIRRIFSSDHGRPMGEGPMFIVFASLSMPEASLTRLIADTTRAGGVVVFRGFPGGSTKAFADGLKRVVTSEGQEAHLAIDPRLFRAFKVSAAPTFVAAGREYELCDGLDCTSRAPDHDRITGNVTVEYALETFAGGRGPGAGVARVALTQLTKGQ